MGALCNPLCNICSDRGQNLDEPRIEDSPKYQDNYTNLLEEVQHLIDKNDLNDF